MVSLNEAKDSILTLNNYSLKIEDKLILSDINLKIYPGEIILFYGPRNSGKSSLLRTFVHLNEELYNHVKGGGDLLYNGKDMRKMDRKFLRSQITYCDTSFVENLNFLTLNELLKISIDLKIKDLTKEHFETLDKLGISHIFANNESLKYYKNLSNWSIGEKISLITFLALARNPRIFIFDSILDHLDDYLLRQVKDLFASIKENITLMVSTRNIALFSDMAEKIALIDKGKLEYYGSITRFMLNFPKQILISENIEEIP